MLVFSSAFTAQAKTSSQSKLDKINQNIKEAQKELDSLDDQVADKKAYSDALMKKIDLLQDKLDALESNRDDLQSEIDAVQKRIDETQAEINKAEKEIEKKEQEFDGVYEEYCQRLRAMYISGNVSMLEVLLESGDISGKTGSALLISFPEKVAAKRLLVLGLGKKPTAEKDFRQAIDAAIKTVKPLNVGEILFALPLDSVSGRDVSWTIYSTLAELHALFYHSDALKSTKEPSHKLRKVSFYIPSSIT